MEISVTHNEGEDFGTLVLVPGRDDSFQVSGYTGEVSIRVPLYSHEATELREALDELAATPAMP